MTFAKLLLSFPVVLSNNFVTKIKINFNFIKMTSNFYNGYSKEHGTKKMPTGWDIFNSLKLFRIIS